MFISALIVFALFAPEAAAQQQGAIDADPVWPLCGRINEAPPTGWVASDGCPPVRFGDPAFNDAPISSTFGPRQLASDSFRYDFHRGIDIGTPIGTPVFAFTGGIVRKAGPDPAYSDPLVQLRHYRPGQTGCNSGGGCYHTNYLHMSSWVVAVGDTVTKGELIGYSGASASGFPHVHFEIRDAPPEDPFSIWQRDAIHPLEALPYPDGNADNLIVTLDNVDDSVPLAPIVTMTVTAAMSAELDLERVEVEVYELQSDGSLIYVAQPGETAVGNTIEGDGYWVDPPFISLNAWNRQYSYKNSSSIPWSSFETSGVYESPYHASLPMSYDPNVHLDAQDPSDPQVGLFNGVRVAPNHTNASSSEYIVTFEFQQLVGVVNASDLCVKVRAVDVHDNATDWIESGCELTGPACGDGVCDVGESCDGRDGTVECDDCPGVTRGKRRNRYCYVDGTCVGPGCP